MLRKRTRESTVTLACIAMGVGVTGAMFSIVDATLYGSRASFAEPSRVFYLDVTRRTAEGRSVDGFAYVDYQALMGRSRSLDRFVAEAQRELPMVYGGVAGSARTSFITSDVFGIARRGAKVGRYPASEHEWGVAAPGVVVSARFAAKVGITAADVSVKSVVVAGDTYAIVAIAPAEFAGTGLGAVDLWLPLAAASNAMLGPGWQMNPRATFLSLLVRVDGGASQPQAVAEVRAIFQSAGQVGGDGSRVARLRLVPVGDPDYAFGHREAVLPFLLIGLGASLFSISVGSVLLLCWAITLALSSEIVVRRALGAPVRAIVQLVLVRLWPLFLAGGALALAVAAVVARVAVWFGLTDGTVTPMALAFTCELALVAALLCSSPVVLIATGLRSHSGLQSSTQIGAQRSRVYASRALVVMQIGVSFALGVLTVLLATSLLILVRANPGFDARRVIAVDVAGGVSEKAADLERTLIPLAERMSHRPDVEGVALALTHPFGGAAVEMFSIPGADTTGPAVFRPTTNAVGADFVRVLGLTVLRGRGILASDVLGAQRVALISAGLEKRYFSGQNAIGKCVRVVGAHDSCTQIVGVVRDFIQYDVTEHDAPRLLVPLAQFESRVPLRTLVVRARSSDATVLQAIRGALAEGAGSTSIAVTVLNDPLSSQATPWTRVVGLAGAFGTLAMIVSLFGVYGLIGSRVQERRTEYGLRAALGASPVSIAHLVILETVMLAATGISVGAGLAWLVMPRFAALLVTSHEQAIAAFCTVALVVAASVVAACTGQALAIARASPSALLRSG